ncbi:unnamed protein product, partial [Porites evermanni]
MKLFAASENNLKRVMTVAKNGMESTGLKWNEKKCAVIHVKRGQVEQGSLDMKVADLKPIKSLDQHNTYKFLGVFENTNQEDKQVLEAAARTYLQRLSLIWSSPLSDHLDREGRNIIVENGENHPKGSTAILYMSRKLSGRVAVADGKEVEAKKVRQGICKARQQEIQSTVSEERWQGKLIKNRGEDEKVKLEECFAWLSSWKNAPTHTIAGVQELYQQLLPTKVYYKRKTKSQVTDEKCRL